MKGISIFEYRKFTLQAHAFEYTIYLNVCRGVPLSFVPISEKKMISISNIHELSLFTWRKVTSSKDHG